MSEFFSSRSSFLSTKSDSTVTTKSSHSSNSNRSVSFAYYQDHYYQAVPEECFTDVYYTGEELMQVRRQEVVDIKSALTLIAESGRTDREIESPTLTWRGIEDYRDGKNKTDHARLHTITVLREWQEQQRGGICDWEMLRQVSKASSRDDRRNADRLADEDAEAQGHKAASRGVKRAISNSFKKGFPRMSLSGTRIRLPSISRKDIAAGAVKPPRTMANAA